VQLNWSHFWESFWSQTRLQLLPREQKVPTIFTDNLPGVQPVTVPWLVHVWNTT